MESKTVELVLDIETIKMDLEKDFNEYEREYLTKFDNENEKFEDKMALYPASGKIVAIAGKNIVSGKGFVVFHADNKYKEEMEDEETHLTLYGCVDEKDILETFWNLIKIMEQAGYRFNRLISYNGKSFDVPFLLLRSAANGVKISHSLGTRSHSGFHIDLLEETCFYGKIRKFRLDLIAKMLGIESHKTEDYNGKKVWEWFDAKMYEEIAHYCYQDVELTEKVYLKLKESWGGFF